MKRVLSLKLPQSTSLWLSAFPKKGLIMKLPGASFSDQSEPYNSFPFFLLFAIILVYVS